MGTVDTLCYLDCPGRAGVTFVLAKTAALPEVPLWA